MRNIRTDREIYMNNRTAMWELLKRIAGEMLSIMCPSLVGSLINFPDYRGDYNTIVIFRFTKSKNR